MRKLKFNSKMIASSLFILLGIVCMVVSAGYGLWERICPDKGFMPFISALLMTVSSAFWFAQSVKKNGQTEEGAGPASFTKNEIKWICAVPSMCLLTVLFIQWLGMHMALAVFLLFWFKCIDKFGWKKSIFLTVLLTVIFWLIFTVGLRVPFPKFFGLF